MIRIFSIDKHIQPFKDTESSLYLKSKNMEFTDKIWQSDIFLNQSTLTKRFKQ